MSGGALVAGVLNTTSPFTAAEAMSVLSNDTDNTFCVCKHGANAAHPDCSIVGANGTSGSNNTGNIGIYASYFPMNGVSVVNVLLIMQRICSFMYVQVAVVQCFM